MTQCVRVCIAINTIHIVLRTAANDKITAIHIPYIYIYVYEHNENAIRMNGGHFDFWKKLEEKSQIGSEETKTSGI